jgi:hypothetical protein
MAAVRASRPQAQATPLVAALAAAAVFELLVLRTFTRTAIHIPALSALQAPYEVIAFAGRYAYFVSVALLMIVLPVLISVLARDRRAGGRVAGAGVALFLVSAGAGAAGAVPPLIMDAGTLVAFTLMLGAAAGRRGGSALLPLAMLGGAFLAGGGFTVLQAAAQDGVATINASWLLTVAEYSGCAFALALPLAVGRRPDRASLIAGGAVTVIAFGSFAANGGATSRILLLWNEGLTGALPGVVYAAAAGALVLAFVSLARSGQAMAAMGVALLVSGGLGLHNTYQTGLVVAGLAALCIAVAPAARDAAAETVVAG